MLLTAVAIPLNMAVEHYVRVLSGRTEDNDETLSALRIGLDTIIDGEFFAATVLISFGAIIGRASPLQLIVMVLGESVFYAINKVVFVLGSLRTEDVGGVSFFYKSVYAAGSTGSGCVFILFASCITIYYVIVYRIDIIR
jgi:ammonium transporter Rh